MAEFFANKEEFQRAVAEAIKPLQEELTAIKANRDTILQEKRKLEGKTEGRTAEGIVRTATHLYVPRDIARDPAAYHRWKNAAQRDGLEMQILMEDLTRSDDKMPMVYTNERKHYVHNSVGRDPQRYREEKAFAERKGLTMHLFGSSSELPPEAFLDTTKKEVA